MLSLLTPEVSKYYLPKAPSIPSLTAFVFNLNLLKMIQEPTLLLLIGLAQILLACSASRGTKDGAKNLKTKKVQEKSYNK